MQVLAICGSTALSDCWEVARSGRHHAKAASTTVSADWPQEPQEGPEVIAEIWGSDAPSLFNHRCATLILHGVCWGMIGCNAHPLPQAASPLCTVSESEPFRSLL